MLLHCKICTKNVIGNTSVVSIIIHMVSTFDLCVRFIYCILSVHTPVDILRSQYKLVTVFNIKKDLQNSFHVHSIKIVVLFQVFLEVLPEMQPELFEECRQPSRYEKVSGMLSYILTK